MEQQILDAVVLQQAGGGALDGPRLREHHRHVIVPRLIEVLLR